MMLDERRRILNTFTIGMADIQLAHNALASEVIVIFNELSIDHYQDSRIAEVDRFKKLAIFRKAKDMNFVPQDEFEDDLVEEGDNLPYEVLMTQTFLPRLPRKDDMVLSDGMLYSVHHVKPMNRDYKGLLQLVVYPERTTFIDTLHIYKAIPLNPKNLLPICDLKAYLEEPDEEEEIIEEPVGIGLGATLGASSDSQENEMDGEGEIVEDEPVGEPNEGEEPEPEPGPEPRTKDIIVDFVWGGKPEFISLDKTKHWFPFKGRIRMSVEVTELHPIIYVKGGMEVIQVIL